MIFKAALSWRSMGESEVPGENYLELVECSQYLVEPSICHSLLIMRTTSAVNYTGRYKSNYHTIAAINITSTYLTLISQSFPIKIIYTILVQCVKI